MSRYTSIALVAIFVALAAKCVSAECGAVSPDNADPPSGAIEFMVLNSSGVRIWDCEGGKVVNASQINGKANFTGDWYDGEWGTNGWTGSVIPGAINGSWIYFQPDIARFNVSTPDGDYAYDLDSKPGLTPQPGKLANARWTVNWLGAAPPAIAGDPVYQTRTNTEGGATPTECPSTTAKIVEVPFNATYTVWACPLANPVNGATSTSFSAVVGALFVAAVALVF